VFVASLAAHDGGFEAQAEGDGYAFVEGTGEGYGVLLEVEFGEEA
jgi:hypothetical protein